MAAPPARTALSRLGGLWPWGCAALSGLLLALCFPGWDQGWLVWIALTPLIAAVWLPRPSPTRRPWLRHALLGYMAGLVFFPITFYWLGSPLAALFQNPWLICLPPLLATYMALYFAFWAWFIGLLPRGDTLFLSSGRNLLIAFAAAAAWVAQEWTRGWLLGGFGWNGLGVALHQNLALIQIADLTGLPGLSFLVCFVNVIALITVRRFIAEIGGRERMQTGTRPPADPLGSPGPRRRLAVPGRTGLRPHWDFSVTMATVVAAFAYGVHALWHPLDLPPAAGGDTVPLRFAAVQPDIPEPWKSDPGHVQQIYDRYDALTHTALAWQPQLLLWPEAATLADVFDANTLPWVKQIASSTEADFIFGSFLIAPGQGDYNIAACLTHHGETLDIYRKMHLVPFGEYIPLRHSFPLFAKIAGELVPGDLHAGTEYTLFHLDSPPLPVAPLVCFEDTVGDLTRRMAGKGANLLVNITNDSWFGQTPGSLEHLDNALFRAIETRRPLLRDTNTGVTCIVDAEGRVLESLRGADGTPFLEGILLGTLYVPRRPPTTLYVRFGDWVPLLSVAITFAGIGFSIVGLKGPMRHIGPISPNPPDPE
jgi:apolipoprotein N-acyltransferase